MSKFVHHVMLHVMLGRWRAGPVTKQTKRHENFYFLFRESSPPVLVFLFPFDVASEDAGYVKRDDHLESTGWTWLQTDHAHVSTGVVEVQVR